MHIADQVAEQLIAEGWTATVSGTFEKLIAGFAEAGTVSNGDRHVTLQIDASGRWFERVDGWGKVVKDVDLREVDGPADAIRQVLADR